MLHLLCDKTAHLRLLVGYFAGWSHERYARRNICLIQLLGSESDAKEHFNIKIGARIVCVRNWNQRADVCAKRKREPRGW
jgi:hypothetical protein